MLGDFVQAKNLQLLEAPSATTDTTVKPAKQRALSVQLIDLENDVNILLNNIITIKYNYTCCCKLSHWQVHVESYPSHHHC